VTNVGGFATLLSWSATLFEYLMPLLVMRSYPETLLDQSCRMALARRSALRGPARSAVGPLRVGLQRRRPPRHYQYKAFGVPGLGLKRGLGDELVVAPYASALAAMLDPTTATDATCAGSPSSVWKASTASTRRSTTPTDARRTQTRSARGTPTHQDMARWCVPTSLTTRA
jgi:hypothetical protein